jgi:serpin B
MKRVIRNSISIIVMWSSIFGPRSTADAAPAQSVVDGNTAFSLDLYAQLKSQPGNLFFSPYSISTALAMTYAGARGQTQKQMADVLHFPRGQQQVHSTFGELHRQFSAAGKQEGIQLNIANALWAHRGHPFLSPFLDLARGDYQAYLNQADFETEPEAARHEINQWVAGATKDKIQDILPPGSLDDLTRLVLANAIYFKGLWNTPFEKAETSSQPFYLSAGRQVQSPLMHRTDEVKYLANHDFQAVELPYKGGELAMVVLLPREKGDCGDLEERLSAALLARTLTQMKQQNVEIFLPRFKLESAFDLNATLGKMGMRDAFGSEADFSGMDGKRFLFISGVFHKAWGEVNEEGTEAAAATAIVATLGMASEPPPPPPVFRADHPFVFLIRDTRSGSILFLGRLAEPRS